jgi:hypothetical protein
MINVKSAYIFFEEIQSEIIIQKIHSQLCILCPIMPKLAVLAA